MKLLNGTTENYIRMSVICGGCKTEQAEESLIRALYNPIGIGTKMILACPQCRLVVAEEAHFSEKLLSALGPLFRVIGSPQHPPTNEQ